MSYRIRPGDTLSGLAQRFGTTVGALAKANHIANPNLIRAGATLHIPGRGDSFAPKKTSPKKAHAPKVEPKKSAPGKATAKGQHLADVARGVASRMNTRGWCAKGVFNSLQKAGLAIRRSPSAYMAANTLAHDKRFREVKLTDAQIRKLPPGAIVVSGAYNYPGNPHGHIAISLGHGREASDHIGPISTQGKQRVFIPV